MSVFGVVAAAVLAAVIYFGAFASVDARDRILELDGGTGRTDIWTVGWRMVEAQPLWGVGAGNFPVASIHYLLEPGALLRTDFIVDDPKVAHNTYLNVLAELGVVGLALFLAILALAVVVGRTGGGPRSPGRRPSARDPCAGDSRRDRRAACC